MIFAVWIFVWLSWADLPSLLVVPFLALLVRANYMDRRIMSLVRILPLFVAIFFFLGYLHDGESVAHSSARALKIVLSALVMFHILEGLQHHSFSLFGEKAQRVSFVIQRSWAVLRERLFDTFHTFLCRWKHPKTSWGTRGRMVWLVVQSFCQELLSIGSRFELSLNARGIWPNVHEWVAPHQRKHPAFLGDAAFMLMAVLPAFVFAPGWVPQQLKELVSAFIQH